MAAEIRLARLPPAALAGQLRDRCPWLASEPPQYLLLPALSASRSCRPLPVALILVPILVPISVRLWAVVRRSELSGWAGVWCPARRVLGGCPPRVGPPGVRCRDAPTGVGSGWVEMRPEAHPVRVG